MASLGATDEALAASTIPAFPRDGAVVEEASAVLEQVDRYLIEARARVAPGT